MRRTHGLIHAQCHKSELYQQSNACHTAGNIQRDRQGSPTQLFSHRAVAPRDPSHDLVCQGKHVDCSSVRIELFMIQNGDFLHRILHGFRRRRRRRQRQRQPRRHTAAVCLSATAEAELLQTSLIPKPLIRDCLVSINDLSRDDEQVMPPLAAYPRRSSGRAWPAQR